MLSKSFKKLMTKVKNYKKILNSENVEISPLQKLLPCPNVVQDLAVRITT